MTTDIYSEGLQIPFLKLYSAGKINQDLVDIIRMNCRIPSRAMGDLRAQVTAVKTGERRFLQLLDRYGREEVLQSIASIMDHCEVKARERTRTIPDGVYEAESYMDDDGIEIGKRIPIKVKVIVEGDELTVDLTNVSQQVRGFYNSGITTGYACTQVAYKCIASPTDYPINDGSFRSLKAIVPPGRIVSAVRPAPMRWWMTFPMTIVDTVFKALEPAIPDRVIAGHHADLLAASFYGINPKSRELFIGNFGPLGGGWGAKRSEDGVSGVVCINDGDTHNSPNEQIETKFPVVVERYAVIPDSGGAGKFRGGLGLERVTRALAPMTFGSQIERAHCRPWGLDGGLEATGNEVALRLDGKWKEDFPSAKVMTAPLKPDDIFRIRSGGGGGYGPPWQRDTAAVADDVKQGYVSVKAAAELYGVAVDPETFAVDGPATERLRAALRAKGKVSPSA
jgi:N-methylhydantoinase B